MGKFSCRSCDAPTHRGHLEVEAMSNAHLALMNTCQNKVTYLLSCSCSGLTDGQFWSW